MSKLIKLLISVNIVLAVLVTVKYNYENREKILVQNDTIIYQKSNSEITTKKQKEIKTEILQKYSVKNDVKKVRKIAKAKKTKRNNTSKKSATVSRKNKAIKKSVNKNMSKEKALLRIVNKRQKPIIRQIGRASCRER